jgi:phosphoglycerate dehydrogenase-like enzyme
MKALLHYRAGQHFRRLLAACADRLQTVIVEPGDNRLLERELADADILLHVLEPVTSRVIDMAPNLKLIQKIGVGTDAIDVGYARSHGVAVCNMPGTNTPAVAEMTLALMFACLRRTAYLSELTKAGKAWHAQNDVVDELAEIGGRTVGLIGYGAVARRLVPVLSALGAFPIAYDQNQTDSGIQCRSLDDLLSRADIVSLHLPATSETAKLMDANRIGLMRPGSVLINTARGTLVDEDALADALFEGRLAAAGLDVFSSEPPPAGHRLFALPNVVAMPHIAWLTQETTRRSIDFVLENSRRLDAGETLLCCV